MNISAVIPLYNKEQYIHRAINSILIQNTPAEEIIVIDDGSTDQSANVVKNISDSRIRLIQQPNVGECAARNKGASEAKNELIAFLDADDEWKPDFLFRIRELVNNFPNCGAYATSAQIIKPDKSVVYPNLINIPPEPWIGLIPDFFELFQAGNAFNASSTVVPKHVLKEIDGFPDSITISGDVACWVNIAMRYPIAFDPARAVIYHQEAQNRVGIRYRPLKQMPYIQLIYKAFDSGLMPLELRSAASEFAAQKQIFVATQNVMAKNPAYARQLLSTCRDTKKYKRDWLWWRLWASLPAGWPSFLLTVKKFLLKDAR